MNEENLKRGNPDTQFKKGDKRAVEAGRKGGVIGGKVRRENAKKNEKLLDMRQMLQKLLNSEYTDKKTGARYSGVEAIITTLFQVALNKENKQCLTAIKMIIDLYGDGSKEKLADKKTKAEIKLLEAKLNAITGENEKFNEDEMPQLWKALGEVDSDESKS